ncbi:MAG: tetratricopeptide repeat protein [Nitrospiria bacterium]
MKSLTFFLLLSLSPLVLPIENAIGEGNTSNNKAFLPPSFREFIQSENIDSMMRQHGIERSDLATKVLLFQAEEALRHNHVEEGIHLAKKGAMISPNSPAPFFFLSKATLDQSWLNFSTSISYYLDGIVVAVSDFRTFVMLLGPVLIFTVMAGIASFITFILYSLTSYGPSWVHHISKHTRKILNPISSGVVFTFLFLTPLITGLPIFWFLFFSFLLFWGFYTQFEKKIVFFFLTGIGGAFLILPFILTLFSANSHPLFTEMSRNIQADYLWTPPHVELDEREWETFSLDASYQRTQGNFGKAVFLYQESLKKNPKSAMILNNLGNLYYHLKDYDKAIEYYGKAIEYSPKLVSAYYNMSQTYREKLLFEQGKKMAVRAEEIDSEKVLRYKKKTTRYPLFPVIEERFNRSDLWTILMDEKKAFINMSDRIWQNWVGSISISQAPFLSGFCMMLLILSNRFYGRFFHSKPCATCSKAVCKRCAVRLFSYQLCNRCGLRFKSIRKKSDFSIMEDASKRIPGKFYPFFLIPGGGHLVIRKTSVAFFLMGVFYLILCSILFKDVLMLSGENYWDQMFSFFQTTLLLVLYVVSSFDLIQKRKNKIWL